MAHGDPWTQAEVRRFKELYDDGLSYKAIGHELGRTSYALEFAKRQNFPGPQRGKNDWSDDLLEKIVQLHADGFPASVVGLIVGRSRSAVLGKWHRLGLRRKEEHSKTIRKIRKVAKAKRRKTMRLPPKPKITADKVADFGGGTSSTVGRPLSALENNQCRFTVASNDTSHLMCGAPGHPWCREHYKVVYRGRS